MPSAHCYVVLWGQETGVETESNFWPMITGLPERGSEGRRFLSLEMGRNVP